VTGPYRRCCRVTISGLSTGLDALYCPLWARRDDSGGVQNVRVALSGYARVRSARPPVVAQVGWTEAEEMFPEVDRFLLRLRGTLQEFVAGAGRCRTCPAPLVLRLAGHAVAVTNGYGADLSGPSVHARADRGG
jgi:hypothetical protein